MGGGYFYWFGVVFHVVLGLLLLMIVGAIIVGYADFVEEERFFNESGLNGNSNGNERGGKDTVDHGETGSDYEQSGSGEKE